MRLAFSAVTAMSGLVLLGIAEYGHPATMLHAARQQWDVLLVADPAPRHDAGAGKQTATTQQVDQLQHEVVALRQALAQRAAPGDAPAPATPIPPPSPAALSSAAPSPAASSFTPPTAAQAPAQGNLAAMPIPQAAPTPRSTTPQPQASPGTNVTEQAAAPRIEAAQPQPSLPIQPAQPSAEAAQPPAEAARPSGETTQASVNPPGMTFASPAPPMVQESPTETIHVAPPALPQSAPQPARVAHAAPAPDEHRAEAVAPPRRSRGHEPAAHGAVRPEDDTQSVLARLRQGTPAPRPPVQPPSAPSESPATPRLLAARSALAAGRIDDAVRSLQEAQLQLVFRPVDAPGENPGAAGTGANDVARALEALSANNIPVSQQYISRAMQDLNGGETNASTAGTDRGWTGYAPAYPGR